MHLSSLAVAAGLLLPPLGTIPPIDAPPIVIRHDRADTQYLALGAQFPVVGRIGRAGDATLIAPQWVLTAAHVVAGVRRRQPAITVQFGERTYGVDEVFAHPEWVEMGPHDLALLRLREPVEGITPLPLYAGTDEANQVATLVGHGDTRTGLGGAWTQDGLRRGATNRVDRADSTWLYFTFDPPPDATDLEGAPGRGDSGGPALLTMDGVPHIAGVSSGGFDGRNGPATYGAVDQFVRVSAYLGWIRQTMAPTSDK